MLPPLLLRLLAFLLPFPSVYPHGMCHTDAESVLTALRSATGTSTLVFPPVDHRLQQHLYALNIMLCENRKVTGCVGSAGLKGIFSHLVIKFTSHSLYAAAAVQRQILISFCDKSTVGIWRLSMVALFHTYRNTIYFKFC